MSPIIGHWRLPTPPEPETPATLITYVNALDAHDWTFEFSDDPSQWARGRDSLRRIEALAKSFDSDFVLWNDRCPPAYRRNP